MFGSGVGVGTTLVVRVCVMAPPVALCGTSRGLLVAGRVARDRRSSIRGVCVMPLPSMMGVEALSLGLCSPPWVAVMGSGSALTNVWWIMMMVVLSLPKKYKETNSVGINAVRVWKNKRHLQVEITGWFFLFDKIVFNLYNNPCTRSLLLFFSYHTSYWST